MRGVHVCVYATKCAIWAGCVQLSALSNNGCLSDWWSDKKLWVQQRQQCLMFALPARHKAAHWLCVCSHIFVLLSPWINYAFSAILGCLPSFCLLAGWVTSTQSSRDSSLSWRRETTLATRPGVETAATEPSTCSPSGPSSVPWVSTFGIIPPFISPFWLASSELFHPPPPPPP